MTVQMVHMCGCDCAINKENGCLYLHQCLGFWLHIALCISLNGHVFQGMLSRSLYQL